MKLGQFSPPIRYSVGTIFHGSSGSAMSARYHKQWYLSKHPFDRHISALNPTTLRYSSLVMNLYWSGTSCESLAGIIPRRIMPVTVYTSLVPTFTTNCNALAFVLLSGRRFNGDVNLYNLPLTTIVSGSGVTSQFIQ